MQTKRIGYFVFLLIFPIGVLAQELCFKLLDDSMAVNARRRNVAGKLFQGDEYCEYADGGVSCTGTLNFLIQHRFGQLNSGAIYFFGLDMLRWVWDSTMGSRTGWMWG